MTRMAGAIAAAFLAGAAVMALEIVASRWLAPGFGSTLATWAALISITLLASALGAAVAARLAARASLAGALTFAGVAMAGTSFVARPLVDALLPLPIELGALLAALALVGPGVFALGAVLPLAAERSSASGAREVGALVAASTLGSFLGTLATALFLAPRLGLRATALAFAALLLFVALAVALRSGRLARGARLAAVAACAAAPLAFEEAAETRLRRASPYGLVEIVPTQGGALLLVDGIVQGSRSRLATGSAGLLARRQWSALLPYLHPEGTRALQTGLGAGELAIALAEHGIEVETIEVNGVLAEMVRDALDFDGPVRVGDGRAVLRRLESRFDFIVLDAFAGEGLPAHLLTREALEESKERLRPGGIFVAHLIARANEASVGAVWRTISAAFPERLALRSGADDGHIEDVFLFGAERPLRVPPHPEIVAAGFDSAARFEPTERDAPILTDDRNPLESLHAAAAREMRSRSRDGRFLRE